MSANDAVCNRPGGISERHNRNDKLHLNQTPDWLARLTRLNDHDFVWRDQIEVRANLLIEQIGIDMMGIETGDLVGKRVMLGLDRRQRVLRGVQLLGDLAPGPQTAIALDHVVGKIGSERRSQERTDEKARAPTHLVDDNHRQRESLATARVNAATRRR
jgi:hypothetical protein